MIELPTGATVSFTGMSVTRHDGTRSHGLGIAPTLVGRSEVHVDFGAQLFEVLDGVEPMLAQHDHTFSLPATS